MADGRMPHAGIKAKNVTRRIKRGQGSQTPRRNLANQGVPGSIGSYANFPEPQKAPPGFLPMTPQFEAGRRGLDDQYQANKMDLLNQQALIKPQYDQAMARLTTDKGYATNRVNENMVDRGIYDSGIRPQVQTRDVLIPYGRQASDYATQAGQQQSAIAAALANADLQYNQGMAELLLNRASDSMSNMPMGVPQYSVGNRVLRGKKYRNKPRRGGNGGR